MSDLTLLYSSRVWSRMGPFIHHSPMQATTSVIVPTLTRIAFFNSAALSSEARERGGGEGEGEGGRGREREGGEREGEGGRREGWRGREKGERDREREGEG